jgi:hypothetical protein
LFKKLVNLSQLFSCFDRISLKIIGYRKEVNEQLGTDALKGECPKTQKTSIICALVDAPESYLALIRACVERELPF